jgi:hypothetical protein
MHSPTFHHRSSSGVLLSAIQTVSALDRVCDSHSPGAKPEAALDAVGLLNAHINPDKPRVVGRARAGKETVAIEREVVVLVDSPALNLQPRAGGLV